MKYTILAATAALSLSPVFGASINATNIVGPDASTIVTDNTGGNIVNVWSGLTTFGGGVAPTDIAGLVSAGATFIGSSDLFGAGGEGLFSNSFNTPYAGASQAIYLVLADNSDLSLATQFGLIDTGTVLDADGALPDSNTFVLGQTVPGSVILGSFNATPTTADWTPVFGGPTTGPQFQLAAIPEPSTTLLGGLAGLALLIRRKR